MTAVIDPKENEKPETKRVKAAANKKIKAAENKSADADESEDDNG
jgi:hypothetical protein